MKNDKIFIQIASYRDPELLPTIKSAFKNALYPENLVFCICWQKDEIETLNEYENHEQVILINVPYNESKGACWARNKIQQFYKGEKYTLQLDSHHRFAENWDDLLIKMYNSLKEKGYKKPLITTYLPSYDPINEPTNSSMITPTKIHYKETCKDGSILFGSSYIDNYKSLTEPLQTYFYSAHFCFTSGDFCINVKHDPNYYFTGEEMNITIRAYTHGYDLFCPHILIAWHEYTRNYRTKHWDDDKEWWKLDKLSKERNRIFFNMELPEDPIIADKETYFGEYWLGNERSIEDYQEFSKIEFKYKTEKIDKTEKIEYSFELNIPEYEYTELQFLFLGFKDKHDKEIYRFDITDFSEKKISVKFNSESEPIKYIWWPYFIETQWGTNIEVKL